MKTTQKIALGAVTLLVVILAMMFLFKNFGPKAEQGQKGIEITVIHGDESEKKFSYQTDEEYLGGLLVKEKLAEGEEGEFGLFITAVDGETADAAKEQWWCITKGGETVNTGVDATPLEDGDAYELTLTEGY